MLLKVLRLALVAAIILGITSFSNEVSITSAQSSYICGYSTDGVLQSGMTGYSYSYIVEYSTGEAIGWNRAGFGLQQYVRIYNPVIVDISPIQLNDGTLISKEITAWSAITPLGENYRYCDPDPTPAAVVAVCGQVIPPSPNNCPPDVGGCGNGEIFIPYGRENSPNEWIVFHPLGIYLRSENNFYFLGDLVGYNQFVRLVLPESELLANPSSVGTIESYEIVDSCESLPTPTLTPTPTPTPPPTPIPPIPVIPTSSALDVSDFKVEPADVSIYEMVKIKMIVENKGAPLNKAYWGYSGQVFLEDGDGNIVERHSFAKGDGSFIYPVIENGRVNFEKWLLTVKVRFRTAVSNGKVIITVQPDVQPSAIQAEGVINIRASIAGLTCTSVLVNKLVGPFSPDVGKALLDAISAGLQAMRCEDGDIACAAPPIVKAFIKVLGRDILGNIGRIIIGIWSVFDTDSLQACKEPVLWMFQLTREFNRQGIPISTVGTHSPVTILVTNSIGQRAGFVSDEEVVLEIPDSRVIEWEGDRYVIYPADSSVIISLKGTGNGTASLTLIDGYSRSEASFSDIPVSDGSNFQLDLSNQRFELLIDNNGDGNFDGAQLPESVEELRPVETPTPSAVPETSPSPVNQPTGICGGALGLIMIPVLTMLVTRRLRKIID